jgi:hypothetical protein
MELTDLLLSILQLYRERFGTFPSKTKLLKLAYLADVLHTRKLQKQLSDAVWIYYLYGPYVTDYDKILKDGPFNLDEARISEEKTATIVSPTQEPMGKPDFDEKQTISSVIHDYGGFELNDLLDHVYFDTEPMINAHRRMETLDFNTVKPQEFYKIRELKIEPRTERALRKAFREKVRKSRGEGTT